ncbi:MAG TPA: hypothetical protein DCO83_14800 [Mucilaginibacter sp.]|jgi:hypothetical protein|nr:hypothetical protein [Mucilaginibacter sp.]
MSNKGEKLIKDLICNPSLFERRGQGYELLQECFTGFPLENLIPLLKSDDEDILKPIIVILSELAFQAFDLLPYVVPLINCEDSFIRYYALECIFLNSSGVYIDEFIHVINGISDQDESNRNLIMHLLSNADRYQLEAGVKLVAKHKIANYKLHQEGLRKLLSSDNMDDSEIMQMLNSNEPLLQQYGVMIAKEVYKNNSKLIDYALTSKNEDVKTFSKWVIDLNN